MAVTGRAASSGGLAFYPATCHPVGRRAVLRGALAALAAPALGAPRAARAGLAEDGAALIRAHARRVEDPWALVHGVRALGPEFPAEDGRPAVALVLGRYLREEAVNGARYLAFPREVEIHPHMFLKTFLEAGVPPGYRFVFAGRERRLEEVIAGAHALFRFSAATHRNTIAWSLIALARTTAPSSGSWTNAWGERVVLGDVVEAALTALEEGSRPLEEARRRGVPPERQAPVHAFTCGGTHLVYSVLTAAHTGHARPAQRERLRQVMDLLVYRLWADRYLLGRFYGPKLASVPAASWFLLDAQVKFVGHAFECLGFARRHGLYEVPAGEAHRVEEAWAVLGADLARLRQLDLGPVRAQVPELYQQIVGDVCHAHHGVRLLGGPARA